MDPNLLSLHFSRTLWERVYRAWVLDSEGMQVASLRVVPCLPLAQEELPPDAPQVGPILLVTVDTSEVHPRVFMTWENTLALQILAQFSHQEPVPRECHFYYPSPLEVHELLEDE